MSMVIDGKSGFFIKNYYVNRHGIMHYFGVKKNSYAGSIIERVYDYFCMGAKSVFVEYIRYYRREFDSYNDFLLRKHNFFVKEISDINKYLLFYKNLSLTEECGITNLLDDEEFNNIIIKFLGGKYIEN